MSKQLELVGIDGANPLGFLAALGALAALAETDSELKLGWKAKARWTPVLTSPKFIGTIEEIRNTVLRQLAAKLRGKPVDAEAECKREKSQKRFEAAKKQLKEANDELKALKLRGNQLKIERDRIVEPVRQRFEKRRQIALRRLKSAVPSPELALGQRPDCKIPEFRQHAIAIRTESVSSARMTADLLAAFGAEPVDLENERIHPTAFCFITGSGHQWFLDTARELMFRANEAKLREALFEPWTYCDEKLTMRWDPVDDRRYALMDRDPTASDNKSTTVWMANLLAYFALALFPCAPTSHKMANACWTRNGDFPVFRWPIWEQSLGKDVIRSLLTHRAFATPTDEAERHDLRSELRTRGVTAIFCSQRIQVGNPPLHKINFSPAYAY